jgi:hypothetical protein
MKKTIMSTEAEYRAAVADLEAAQRRLGQTPRSDGDARAAATREVELATARVREAKDALKSEAAARDLAAGEAKGAAKRLAASRNFAGLTSPLYDACVARFDVALVAELEADALSRQADRDQRSAERRQAKKAREPTPPAPRPLGPEVYYCARRGQP